MEDMYVKQLYIVAHRSSEECAYQCIYMHYVLLSFLAAWYGTHTAVTDQVRSS